MADKQMRFDITANDRASAAFAKVGEAVDKLAQKLDELGRKVVKPRVTADTEAAKTRIEDLNRALRDLSNQRVRVDVDLGNSRREVGDLRRELSYLRDVRLKVDLDSGSARSDITAIAAALRDIRDANVKIDVDSGSAVARLVEIADKLHEIRALSPLTVTVEVDDQASARLSEITALSEELSRVAPTVRVDLTGADEAIARIAELRAQLDRLGAGSTSIRVELDSRTFLGELARIQTELNTLAGGKVKIDADTRQAMEELAALRVRLAELSAQPASVQVDADTAAARAEIEVLERRLAEIAGRQYTAKVDVDDNGSASKVTGMMVALAGAALYASPALGSLTAAAATLAGSLASLAGLAPLAASGLVALGSSVATIKLGVGGIGDAFKALANEQTVAASAAVEAGGKQVGASNAIATAARSLQDAQRNADRAAVDGARSVQDARQGLADAIDNGNQQVAAAEERVQRAEEARQVAQEGLTRAIRDAKEAQDSLTSSLANAELSQEGAVLALERAQLRLANMPKGSTALDFKDAELAVRRASQAIVDAKDRYGDLQEQSAQSAKVGVMGADNVVSAQRRLSDANRGVGDAERQLSLAREKAADSVTKANERVAVAQMSAQRANEDAARNVQRAQAAVEQSYAKTTTGVGALSKAADKANDAMAKLAPSAQEFVRAVIALKPAWTDLGGDVQQRMFEGVGKALTDLASVQMPNLRTGLVGIAGGFNDAFRATASFLSSASAVRDVGSIMDATSKTTGLFASTLKPISSIFLDTAAVSAPILTNIAQGFANSATRAAEFVTSARDSGQLGVWLQNGLDTLRQLGSVLGNVGSVFMSVFSAAKAAGSDFLTTLDRVTGKVAEFLRSGEGQNSLKLWFDQSRQAIDALLPGLATLAGGLVSMTSALANTGGLVTFGKAISDIASSIAPLLPQIGQLAGNALGQLGTAAARVAGFLAPIAGFLLDILNGMGPIGPAVVAATVAFLALGKVGGAISTLGATVRGAATSVGTMALGLTNSAAAGQAASSATSGFGTALGKVGSALPLIGVAVVGVGLAYDQLKSKADDAAKSALSGSVSFTQAIDEERNQIEKRNALFGDANLSNGAFATSEDKARQAALNQAEATKNVNEELDKQRALMSPLQQLQSDVARATRAAGDAQVQFGADSLQARDSGLALESANRKLKDATDGVAAASKSEAGQIRDAARAAQEATSADLNYQDSVDRTKDAITRLTAVSKDDKASAEELGKAQRDVTRASLDQAEAARKLAEANAAGKSQDDITAAGSKAYRDELQRLADQATGPTKAALQGQIDKLIQTQTQLDITRAKSGDYKGALGDLAGMADGTLAAAIRASITNFDNLGGAHASAEQRAILQKQQLQNLAAMASGPLRQSLLDMANQINTLPDGNFTVTAQGSLGAWQAANPQLFAQLADGGVMPGYTPGSDVHTFISPTAGRLDLSGGEAVMRPEWTRAVGPGYVNAANAAARVGGVGGVESFLGQTGFASGGIIGAAPPPAQQFALGGFVQTGEPYRTLVKKKYLAARDLEARGLLVDIRAEIAAAKARAAAAAAAASSSGGSYAGGPPGAGVERWRPMVGQALGIVGQPQAAQNITLRRMNQESGGNPNIVNTTDSNWQAGTPSVGLMQVIGPTYRSYRDPAHDVGPYSYGTSVDPLSNTLASMRYAMSRYGSLAAAYNQSGGYDKGGLATGRGIMMKDIIAPERVLDPRTTVQFERMVGLLESGALATRPTVTTGGGVDLSGVVAQLQQVRALLATVLREPHVINMPIYNPSMREGADSVAQAARTASTLGLFGGR